MFIDMYVKFVMIFKKKETDLKCEKYRMKRVRRVIRCLNKQV